MKSIEDIRFAISILPPREWLEITHWIAQRGLPRHLRAVGESRWTHGMTESVALIQHAVRRLDLDQMRELCDCLQSSPDDSPEVHATLEEVKFRADPMLRGRG